MEWALGVRSSSGKAYSSFPACAFFTAESEAR